MKEVIRPLRALRIGLAMELQRGGLLRNGRKTSTRNLLDARRRIQEELRSQGPGYDEDMTRRLLHLSAVQAKAMTISHALELVETQGIGPFRDFMGGLIERRARQDGAPRSRAVSDLAQDENVVGCFRAAEGLDIEHPKVPVLQRMLAEEFDRAPGSRVLIFSHYRSTSEVLLRAVSGIEGARPCRFIGQANKEGDKGLRQREQAELIERFKDGTYNVMIATSVAEEGLDIPSTDLVVFYEPVASEIRHIQRRGRTGRARTGRVEVLMTRGTKDETAFWAIKGRERRSSSGLDRLMEELGRHIEVGKTRLIEDPREEKVDGMSLDSDRPDQGPTEVSVDDGTGQGPVIIIDNRELGSQVVKGLALQGRRVEPCQLEVGDYLLSDRVCVERKTVRDLSASLFDGRLFVQMRALTRYPRPLLVVEGPGQPLERGVSPRAIEGALVSIMVDFGVPVIRTSDAGETATLLATIADREWKERGPVPTRRLKGGKDMDLRDRMHLIVEGLPNISAIMSRRLLAHFRTVKAIANASIDELQDVKGIGKRTAHAIHETVTGNYSDVDQDLA
jgi:ERCC4-type nuclease